MVVAGGLGVFAVVANAGAADDQPAAEKDTAKKVAPAKRADGNAGTDVAGDLVSYARHIQPILKESCVQCHKAPAANAGRGPGDAGARGPGQGGAGGAGARRPGGPGGPGGGPRGPAGGLRLDDKAMILKGGKHGKAVLPGKGDESLLYRVLKEPVTIDGDEVHAMPKARPGQEFTPINDDEIELIKKWIDQGAK
jgi:hypothetical protein